MIAIKDMEMPKTCTMCWLSPMCKVHGEKPEWMGYNTRMDGCPLVEIVTCADCRHLVRYNGELVCGSPHGMLRFTPDGFCKYGEERR